MIIVLVLLLAVSLSTTIWYQRKKANYRIPQNSWQNNELHETDDNENEDQITERIPANTLEESEVQGTDVRLVDLVSHIVSTHKTLELSILSSTQIVQYLGRCQYGTIFNGKLVLGKSVCVDST